MGSTSESFGYDDDDRRTSMTLPNGVVTSYFYDAAWQLTGINYTIPAGNNGTVGSSWYLIVQSAASCVQ